MNCGVMLRLVDLSGVGGGTVVVLYGAVGCGVEVQGEWSGVGQWSCKPGGAGLLGMQE